LEEIKLKNIEKADSTFFNKLNTNTKRKVKSKKKKKNIGEVAERSNAAVLKTVLVKANGGSNPSLSASRDVNHDFFCAVF
jgi:hypothetical protein